MKIVTFYLSAILFVIIAFAGVSTVSAAGLGVELRVLGTYSTGAFNQGASEIVAYDAATRRLFTVNGATSQIDVLSIANPSAPTLLFSINLALFGRQANSVAVRNGIVAVAVEANTKTDNGQVVFFDANGNFLRHFNVGALPDMITFTPDGRKVLVANEGEPNNDYTIDPQGSVSIVDLSNGLANASVTTASFAAFNNTILDSSIRIYGPNATVAQDLEPEFIAVSPDSNTAWVTLQENNAVGILDLTTGQFTRLVGLGFKHHMFNGNGLDVSDRDNMAIHIATWQVFGMYQPDGIAAYNYQNQTYLITANEGDAREYTGTPGLLEEVRASSLMLDPIAFPNAGILQNNARLGRLNVTNRLGDNNGDGDFDALFALGGRSFSILNAAGQQVFDSGDAIERITAQAFPAFFNASNTNNTIDDRSDNKGPEPEGVTIGNAFGCNYAFIGLERMGGVLVYDVTNPFTPHFVQYINNRNFLAATNTAAALDLGPEGLHFISAADSPNGTPLLVVANEISGTTTVYEFVQLAPANEKKR